DGRELSLDRGDGWKQRQRWFQEGAAPENAAILLRDRHPGELTGDILLPGPIAARENQGPEIAMCGWHAPFRCRTRAPVSDAGQMLARLAMRWFICPRPRPW